MKRLSRGEIEIHNRKSNKNNKAKCPSLNYFIIGTAYILKLLRIINTQIFKSHSYLKLFL